MIGVLVLIASSAYVIDSAVGIANLLGISKVFIAATTIALGTSLPELAVNLSAVKKKHYNLALGNVIGSCMTNLTLILGISAVIQTPTAKLVPLLNLIIFQILINAALIYMLHKRKVIGRHEGFLLLGGYVVFLASALLVEMGG